MSINPTSTKELVPDFSQMNLESQKPELNPTEIEKILVRYKKLPKKFTETLPKDTQKLADEVASSYNDEKAKVFEKFLECRDNLIFWQKVGIKDANGNSIDLTRLKTEEEYFQQYEDLKHNRNYFKKDLKLQSCGLTSIPKDLHTYYTGNKLFLAFNNISDFHEMKQLVRIDYMDLSRNQLTWIPSQIGNFPGMKSLDLSHNSLSTIPPEIEQLTQLELLDISYNPITLFPPQLNKLKKLETFTCTINGKYNTCTGHMAIRKILKLLISETKSDSTDPKWKA